MPPKYMASFDLKDEKTRLLSQIETRIRTIQDVRKFWTMIESDGSDETAPTTTTATNFSILDDDQDSVVKITSLSGDVMTGKLIPIETASMPTMKKIGMPNFCVKIPLEEKCRFFDLMGYSLVSVEEELESIPEHEGSSQMKDDVLPTASAMKQIEYIETTNDKKKEYTEGLPDEFVKEDHKENDKKDIVEKNNVSLVPEEVGVPHENMRQEIHLLIKYLSKCLETDDAAALNKDFEKNGRKIEGYCRQRMGTNNPLTRILKFIDDLTFHLQTVRDFLLIARQVINCQKYALMEQTLLTNVHKLIFQGRLSEENIISNRSIREHVSKIYNKTFPKRKPSTTESMKTARDWLLIRKEYYKTHHTTLDGYNMLDVMKTIQQFASFKEMLEASICQKFPNFTKDVNREKEFQFLNCFLDYFMKHY